MLYGVALIFIVLLFSIGIYTFVQRLLISQIDNHLRRDLATVGEYLRNDPAGLQKLAHFGAVHLFRVRDGNRTLIRSQEWATSGLDEQTSGGDLAPAPILLTTDKKQLYRVRSSLLPLQDKLYQIVVAHEQSNYQRTLNTLALIILLILPVSIALSLVVGYLIAGRVLSPVAAITAKAQEINAENLEARLPVTGEDNEFNNLAQVFNQTFSRLENSFEQLRRFTSDASHELRTPLTAIRSIGETALQQQRLNPESAETIGSMLEETDRLVQTVESLLLLSRADSQALMKEPVEVGDLLADVVEFLSVLAEEKQQQIVFERQAALQMETDSCMLRRAFLNLVDNAVKYSPEKAVITVRIYYQTDGFTVVEVADQGSGIPDQDKLRVFDRFYRIDNGRCREKGGTGLGLAITRASVEAHGGQVSIHDNPDGGTLFRVRFAPAQTEP